MDQKFIKYAVDHVNEDHAEAMLTILKFTQNIEWPDRAVLNTYDCDKMIVTAYHNDKKEQFCKWVFNLNQNSKQKKKSKDNDDEDNKEEESQRHPHILASIVFKTIISRLSWHAKADFLATMAHNI